MVCSGVGMASTTKRQEGHSFKKHGRVEKGREMVAVSRRRRSVFLFSFNERREAEVL